MLDFCTHDINMAPPGCDAVLQVRIQMIGDFETDSAGNLFATPDLVTDAEIDFYIDRIIENLQRVKAEAKARLSENCG